MFWHVNTAWKSTSMIHVTNTAPKHLKIKGHLEKGYTVQKSQIIPWDYKRDTKRKLQHHPNLPHLPQPQKYKPKEAWRKQECITALAHSMSHTRQAHCSQQGYLSSSGFGLESVWQSHLAFLTKHPSRLMTWSLFFNDFLSALHQNQKGSTP